MMNKPPEDYSQPFYVNYDMAKRMGYNKPFYLPPLEPKIISNKEEGGEEGNIEVYRHYPHQHTYTRKQASRLFLKIEALEKKSKYLYKKIEELMARKGKRRVYKDYVL